MPTSADTIKDADLIRFGYAPGDYWIICITCQQQEVGMDKRAVRCKSCAEKMLAQYKEEPVNLKKQIDSLAGMAIDNGQKAVFLSDRLVASEALVKELESALTDLVNTYAPEAKSKELRAARRLLSKIVR